MKQSEIANVTPAAIRVKSAHLAGDVRLWWDRPRTEILPDREGCTMVLRGEVLYVTSLAGRSFAIGPQKWLWLEFE